MNHASRCTVLVVLMIWTLGRSGSPKQAVLTADMPLHLEDHLAAAIITGSELPAAPPESLEWRFDEPRPDWTAIPAWNPPFSKPVLSRVGDGLRVSLTDGSRIASGQLRGSIGVTVPNLLRSEWAEVVIRARADAEGAINSVSLGFNVREGRGQAPPSPSFQFAGQQSPVARDGTIHTYRLRVNAGSEAFRGPWRQLLLTFGSLREPGSIDLISVSVVPTSAAYAGERTGMRSTTLAEAYRRSLFTHAPARIEYQVRVPDGGRLQAALGVLRADVPVEFTVDVRRGEGDAAILFLETYSNADAWADRTIDLSGFAGQTIRLGLETKASPSGTVAFWDRRPLPAHGVPTSPT